MRVVWLPSAVEDLQRLREFLRPQNPEASRRAVATIGRTAEILAENPSFGKVAHEATDFRDVIIPFGRRSYVLRYRIDAQTIVIVALRHCREVGFPDH
jgi:plasmid stabilization system protein ParE